MKITKLYNPASYAVYINDECAGWADHLDPSVEGGQWRYMPNNLMHEGEGSFIAHDLTDLDRKLEAIYNPKD